MPCVLESSRLVGHVCGGVGCVGRQSLSLRKIEVPARPLVPVLCNAIECSPAFFQQAAGPVGVRSEHRFEIIDVFRAIRALQPHGLHHLRRTNQRDCWISFAHFPRKIVVLDHEVFQVGVADLKCAPWLVPDIPVLDVVGLRMAVLCALSTPVGGRRTVQILDLFCGRVSVAEPRIHCDVRIDIDQLAEAS